MNLHIVSWKPCHLAENNTAIILISSEDESEMQYAKFFDYETIRQSYVSGLLNR